VRKVADHSTTNRMTIDNLVIIFSPACQISNELCRSLITDYNKIFASVLGISNEREDKKKQITIKKPTPPPPQHPSPSAPPPNTNKRTIRFTTPPKKPPTSPFRSKSNQDLLNTSSPAPKRPTVIIRPNPSKWRQKSPPSPRQASKGPRALPKGPRALPKSPGRKFGIQHANNRGVPKVPPRSPRAKQGNYSASLPRKPMRPVPPPKPSRKKLSNSNPFASKLAAFETNSSGSKSYGSVPSNRPNLTKINPFENY